MKGTSIRRGKREAAQTSRANSFAVRSRKQPFEFVLTCRSFRASARRPPLTRSSTVRCTLWRAWEPCRGSQGLWRAALCDFTRSDDRHRERIRDFRGDLRRAPRDDELQFEKLLWQQLRRLHELDAAHFDWDPNVRSDPADPHFSFSFGGQALYVIGMHANSSREARRFPWPALVFNPHEQFERLRADGKWKRMQETIRARDLAAAGIDQSDAERFRGAIGSAAIFRPRRGRELAGAVQGGGAQVSLRALNR